MKQFIESLIRIILLTIILISWLYFLNTPLSKVINLSIIVGGVLLTYPLVWMGRKILDRHHSLTKTIWITTAVHFGLGFTFGIPIVLAISTHHEWTGLILPVPSIIGLILVVVTGMALFLTVLNLALKGFGAPFFIKLSQKLAADWMYAWTRNPMVLAGISFLLSLGIWFQSLFFLIWGLLLFTPALLFFIKVFEERELEFRFGASYLAYKAKTSFLFPRKPTK
jgi:protein-S-isoprenylcysteine O-methyltransferase Ste14